MRTTVITKNYIEGFHNYPEAAGSVDFLKHKHRHIFHVECGFEVTDNNREVEIFTRQFEIGDYFAHVFGVPARFGTMSCEMIAERILSDFQNRNIQYVKVLEDGEGGAVIQQ
jgi:hypothetical protein